jgi:amidase
VSDPIRITRNHTTCVFDPAAEPVAEIQPGQRALFETWDALGGRVRTVEDALTLVLPPEQLNPATGPVYVAGAEPGDTLVVKVERIELAERGQSRIRAGSGVIINELNPPRANLVYVRDGTVIFNEQIRFPARPMVGVVGVAPSSGLIATFYPGAHGGNLDINDLGPGATVYLPVSVPGALLSIGDVHAHMGDGELTGGGIDIPAEVTVQVSLLRGFAYPRPLIETADAWSTCAYAPTLPEAVRMATRDMVDLLSQRLGISREEAFQLVGAAGDARIGQAAELDMDATAYVRVPKTILPHAFG